MRIEFLIEEYSMKLVLENLLPKILPPYFRLNEHYFIRPHQGKSDLKKSIPKKIKAYNNMGSPVGIIILHDQDSNDCKLLKKDILNLCSNHSVNIKCLTRIVCRELESWYLGDMAALEKSFPKFNSTKFKNKARFRNPDNLNAYPEIKRLIPSFQKIDGARKISPNLEITRNKSMSFNHFVSGVQNFLKKT